MLSAIYLIRANASGDLLMYISLPDTHNLTVFHTFPQ